MQTRSELIAKAADERRLAANDKADADRFAEREEWDDYDTSLSWAAMHENRAALFERLADEAAPVEMRKAG